ncbi:MAG: hypothetical protein V4611_01660 [Patescibacteria group bacterium]
MRHTWVRLHAFLFNWRHLYTEELVALVLVLFIFISPASAAMRLQERSLYINSSVPGATTSYTLGFRYMSPQAVGSLDLLFCVDPIPYHDCVTPPGLNASNAVLSEQTGETGFTIQSKSTNHIVLSRSPSPNINSTSSYKFDNIVNPTDTSQAFSIRIKSLASTDGTGAQIDFGSVRSQVTNGIFIETQVPPMLIFCLAQEVQDDCAGTNDTFYTDMGTLDSNSTLTAQSQMAVGTNATGGFAITVNGTSMSAATNVIDSPSTPTKSTPGKNQFGINLVENIEPGVGKDPEGEWANAVASLNYSTPNMYMYVPGDVVAYSPNVSLMKKFTVSYVLNASPNLRAGVYTTTLTFIASGRF